MPPHIEDCRNNQSTSGERKHGIAVDSFGDRYFYNKIACSTSNEDPNYRARFWVTGCPVDFEEYVRDANGQQLTHTAITDYGSSPPRVETLPLAIVDVADLTNYPYYERLKSVKGFVMIWHFAQQPGYLIRL